MNLILSEVPSEGSEAQTVELAQLPGAIIGINLDPAGFFTGAAPSEDFGLLSMNIYGAHDMKDKIKKLGGRVLLGGTSELSSDDVGRFIAKIAHSYAVAELGIGSFIPFLTRAIRGDRPMNLSRYVGGPFMPQPIIPTQREHVIHIAECKTRRGENYVMARVRLFAPFNLPVYDVVVGQATAATVYGAPI
jgi:hypothetical protein